jgi:hypothetical protein
MSNKNCEDSLSVSDHILANSVDRFSDPLFQEQLKFVIEDTKL